MQICRRKRRKKILQNVQIWLFSKKKDGFSEKNLFFLKSLKVAKLLQNVLELFKYFQRLENCVFFKNVDGSFETKSSIFLEPLKFKRRKLAVESAWDSKNSQKMQTLDFLKKILDGFCKKSHDFFIFSKFIKFAADLDWDS